MSVRVLTQLLPVVLSPHPSNMRIIIHFDFSLFLEKLAESFTGLLALNTWLTSACLSHGIKFIDNFNIFWNCKDRFQHYGFHPNIPGSRLPGANLSHVLGMNKPKQEWTDNSQGQVWGTETDSLHLSPSPDSLLQITQRHLEDVPVPVRDPRNTSCLPPQPPRSQR